MASTPTSNDTPIAEILKEIDEGTEQLPDFQRGWVWDDERIRALIASISNSYPVGALMVLGYGGDTVHFKYRPFTGAECASEPEKLVLDGQQRLTSIYSAMYCRKPVLTMNEKKKRIERYYYLDIRKCLSGVTDRTDAIVSVPKERIVTENFGRDIVLDISTREKEFAHEMFPLNIVFNYPDSSRWLDDYREYHNYDTEARETIRQFNDNVLRVIQDYKVPVIVLDKSTPKEAVCQVFENVNTGGVSLTIFELITATFAADNYELRKDWEERHERLAQRSQLKGVSATDFLTAITLLIRYARNRNSGGEAVSCKKKDILAISLSDYQENADILETGFFRAANFLQEQRIFSLRDLPYSTQLIPLAVLFAVLGEGAQDSIIKNKLMRWYWCGVFGEMYGGANETRFVNDVVGVVAWINGGGEPDTVTRAYFQPTRLLSMQSRLSAAYKGVMAQILKAGALDFISGADMDFTTFSDQAVDIHHIYPHDYCEKMHYEKEKWNSIVNKTPLTARSNRILGGNAPSRYLEKLENDGHIAPEDLDIFVATHLIEPTLLRGDKFEAFITARAKSLLHLIGNAMGKQITELGSEDVISAFGQSLE